MPALLDHKKTSTMMQKALHTHIMHERDKRKKEAAEAEKDFERKAKEEEEKRKQLEEEHSTLEDIKEQLIKLHEKEKYLREEKHQLFWQFKKVLNEEAKRKARLREQSEIAPSPSPYQQHGIPNAHHLLPQGLRYQNHHQQSLYLNQGSHSSNAGLQQGTKRPHSPTPPTSSVIQMYQRPSTTMHSSPQQQKYDSSFSGLQKAYRSSRGSAPDRPSIAPNHSYPNSAGKPQDQSTYNMDNRSRSRITMIPPSQSSSPFSSNLQMRSNSPGRFNVKPERDHASYSPSSGNPPLHHKYQSLQSGGKIYTKY